MENKIGASICDNENSERKANIHKHTEYCIYIQYAEYLLSLRIHLNVLLLLFRICVYACVFLIWMMHEQLIKIYGLLARQLCSILQCFVPLISFAL